MNLMLSLGGPTVAARPTSAQAALSVYFWRESDGTWMRTVHYQCHSDTRKARRVPRAVLGLHQESAPQAIRWERRKATSAKIADTFFSDDSRALAYRSDP